MSKFNPLDIQVGGDHYKNYRIQPIELYSKFELGFKEASIIRYCIRHKNKDGKQDLQKALHLVEMLQHFNNPIGRMIDIEYIEAFVHQNKLDTFMVIVLEELSLWIHSKSNNHLINLALEIETMIKSYS